MECPGTEMFQLLFGGQLSPEQHGPLADHAATCPACHAVVEALVTQQGPPPEPQRIAAGTVIGGRFKIEQILGRGGMGIVVEAIHLELGNRVAIKFMRDDRVPSVGAAERFIREARAVVKLRTEHVCQVFDVARLDSGAPYIVMELLQGVDLARTIAARPLPATIAVEYVMQAAVAVAEAHAAGIVHRDLKPANLFVTRRPDGGPLVKVLDFGVAKALSESDSRLTLTRTVLGSPGYMSPEQFESPRDVDARTDIWSLGVTLYQLLSGRLPFWGRNQTETAVKIATDVPPPLEVDPRLSAVVFRCLEKAREDRYQDVAALVVDLVPFGGPRGRRISAKVTRAASQAITAATPAAQPVVLPGAPTTASVASLMAESPPAPRAARDLAAGSRSSRASRARIWRLATMAAVGLVVAGGVAVAVRSVARHGEPAAGPPGSIGSSVSVAVAGVPTRGAAPDAAAPSVAPGSGAAPDKAEPRDGKVAPSDAKDARRASEASNDFAAQARQACEEMTKPAKAKTVAAKVIVACWCQLRDETRARQAFGRISSSADRETARRACANQGIELK